MPYAVLWDMDGTLVDTAELHFQAWKTLADCKGWPFSREDFHATFGRRNPEIIHQLFGRNFTDPEIAELGEEKENLYREQAAKGISLLPGVHPLLEELQQAGFAQAIASSAPRKNLELILQITGTEPFFQAIVSMEDTQRGKPDPQVFQIAAQKVQVPADHCVVIEDAVAGVQAAKAGGMKCIAVTFVGHHSEEKLMEAGADLVIPTLESVNKSTIQKFW